VAEFRRAGTVEEVVAAEHLFDGPAQRTASERFLAGARARTNGPFVMQSWTFES
jgi:hypothetical protein